MIQPDSWIIAMAKKHRMIAPFEKSQVRAGVISYGVSSYGYDIRVADEFRIFSRPRGKVIDPKDPQSGAFKDVKTSTFALIPPHSFALARTVEYFRIPRNVITIGFGKSTYARCGVLVNITPFEPEWEGYATLGIINTAPVAARIYANEGIAQILFLQADKECAVSYADKKGKYQAQKAITHARI